MKTGLILFFTFISLNVFGQGDAPPFTQGQSQSSKSVSTVIKVPNNQVTKLSSSQVLLETGNKNLLVNPSFEALPSLDVGWSILDTETAITGGGSIGSTLDGITARRIVCSGGLSGGTCTFYQDAPTATAVQGVASAYISTNTPTYLATNPVKIYARKNGVNQSGSVAVVTGSLKPYKVPVELGTTSTGIAIEITVVAGQTITATIDDTFVGAEQLTATGQQIETQFITRAYTRDIGAATYNGALSSDTGARLLSYDSSTGIFTALKATKVDISASGIQKTNALPILILINLPSGTPASSSDAASGGSWASASGTALLTAGQTFTISNLTNTSASDRLLITATDVLPVTTYSQPYYATDRIGELFDTTNPIAPSGFISALGSVIGATSSAATFKGDSYWPLYEHLWSVGGLTTTAGYPYRISSAKGASASADWAANKTITIDYATNAIFRRAKAAAATVGSYVDDTFQGHKHSGFSVYGNRLTSRGSPTGSGYELAELSTMMTGYAADGGNGTPRVGAETAPDHSSFYVYIRYQADNQVAVLNLSGLEKCADTYECTETFTAFVDAAGVVSQQNVPGWITGNVPITDTSIYTIPVNTSALKLTTGMVCVANAAFAFDVAQYSANAYASSSSSVSVRTGYQPSGGAYTKFPSPFFISCGRSAPDYIGKTAKAVASDQNVRSIGSIGVDIQSVYFGSGADCSTACTTGSCTICNRVGTKVTSVSFSSTGNYDLNGIDGTKYNCQGGGIAPGVSPTTIHHSRPLSTSTYARMVGSNTTTGASVNAALVSVTCTGIP